MQKKPLKTTDRTIIEGCEFVQYSDSLKLLGCSIVNERHSKYFGKELLLTEEQNSFRSAFEHGYFFYYELFHHRGKEVLFREVGIGEINEDCIDRHYCLFNQFTEDEVTPSPAFYKNEISSNYQLEEYLQVSYYPVSNAMQLFIAPHTVPFTGVNGPSTIEIEEHSVLGRAKGSIQSIKINDLFKVPSRKPTKKAAKGTIILDSDDGSLKIYNGSEWKVIKYEDT